MEEYSETDIIDDAFGDVDLSERCLFKVNGRRRRR